MASGATMKKTCMHRWELLVNYPVFTMVMVIYHYVEKIVELLLHPIFPYNIYDH